jgi:hypothetical protein
LSSLRTVRASVKHATIFLKRISVSVVWRGILRCDQTQGQHIIYGHTRPREIPITHLTHLLIFLSWYTSSLLLYRIASFLNKHLNKDQSFASAPGTFNTIYMPTSRWIEPEHASLTVNIPSSNLDWSGAGHSRSNIKYNLIGTSDVLGPEARKPKP